MKTDVFDLVKELQQIRIDIQSGERRLEDTIQQSLKCVDSLSHMLTDVFDLTTAVALCKAGYFVKHLDAGSNESLHYYDGILYYEDGTIVTVHELNESGRSNNWLVKKNPLEIDLVRLRNMHAASKGAMLIDGSYEDCFK